MHLSAAGRQLPGGLPAAALAFAAGNGLFFSQTRLPAGWLLLTCAALLLLGAARWRWLGLPALLILGFAHAQQASCPLLCAPFPAELLRQDMLIEGRIAGLPDRTRERTRFVIEIASATHGGQPVHLPERARLSWYRDAPPLASGEQWRLLVRLKPPHGFINPAGFDYERWLFQQGIGATGYVRASEQNQKLGAGSGGLDLARQHLGARIVTMLGENRASALVRALFLGDREGLAQSDWQTLTRTGTNHLLAISGLHIGLIAAAVFFLARSLWVRLGSLSLWLAAPRAGALAALLAALGYSALAGFAISTQRALVMLAVVLVALLAGRTPRPLTALSLALIAVLLIDPLALLSYGFWLSFGAVAALLHALGGRIGRPRLMAGWTQAQWAVALGLLPLLLWLFGRASVIAPLVNLVAVPLFSVLLPVILLATLVSLASGWVWPLALVGDGLNWGFGWLETLAELPWASLSLSARPLWAWLAAILGVALLLAPRGLPARWLGWLYLLPLLLLRPPAPAPGSAAVTVLDVGQGLAVAMRSANHTLVYDVGPRFPSGFNTGSAVVAPYLRAHGIDRIDLLILSHADNDHAGGLAGLLEEMPVARLLTGEPHRLKLPPSADIHIEPCETGQRWHWDGVDLRMFHPPPGQHRRGNESSCVLHIATGGGSLLLTGDIGTVTEGRLIARYGEALRADVLVAGHHGSATSSSRAFLRAVDPHLTIYSAGFANRWDFPAAEVRARVQSLGIAELNTASAGGIALRLPSAPPLPRPVLSRQQRNRLWRHHPWQESASVPAQGSCKLRDCDASAAIFQAN